MAQFTVKAGLKGKNLDSEERETFQPHPYRTEEEFLAVKHGSPDDECIPWTCTWWHCYPAVHVHVSDRGETCTDIDCEGF